jgi:glycosyltransferase involved in cell wall biosynthesis
MQSLKISIIIPAYNEEKYIGKCLKYAIENSGGNFFEIIVVDNASSDKTAEIAKKYPGVRVVLEEKKGPTWARERGFKESSGDILAYIDADNLMPKGWCERIIKEFKKDKHLVCLSGPYAYYDVSLFKRFMVVIWYAVALPIYWILGYMATGGNLAIRRDILEKMKGFDTSIDFYGDDTNLARRANRYGKVKFKLNFIMHSSGRRFNGQGLVRTGYSYLVNFISEVFLHKPMTKDYIDIR